MDRDFWLTRWQNGQIGFHLNDVNPHLFTHQAALPHPDGARIFVPLCGKSLDLSFLRTRGYEVVGVELSELAVSELFREQGLTPTITRDGELLRYQAAGITVFCGDFFTLTPAQLGKVEAFYDRASLVALPPELRVRYAAHMHALLPSPVAGLAICFDYAQEQMNGPPFAVSEPELRSLYEPQFKVTLLASYDVLENEPRFRQAGLTSLYERVFRLER
jgi:thiopurine S-methyltransferase